MGSLKEIYSKIAQNETELEIENCLYYLTNYEKILESLENAA